MNIEGLREKFNEKRYSHGLLGHPDRERVRKLVYMVDSSRRVLDVGCGKGELGRLLISNKNDVYGLDISKTCVKESCKVGMRAKIWDLESNKFPFSVKFDVVLAGEIIEHIVDTDSFLKKVYDSLKEEGELILSTPNLAAFGRRLLLLLGKNPHMEVSFEPYSAGHVRYFIKDTLIWLLKKNKFEVLEFVSDVVNFNASGSLSSTFLAQAFPTLGKSLIVRCKKNV